MKIAYFDCFSGVSGDMILGALIDAGLKLYELEEELKKLKINGYKIYIKETKRKGIKGTKFNIEINEKGVERNLEDILKIVDESDLDNDVKIMSEKIFKELALVESRIHREDIRNMHFHEVGGLDSIIDVIGSIIGIKKLGIESVYSSPINVGGGFVKCMHGILPVPAPATAELLKNIPVYSNGTKTETATPTGVVIIKNLSKGFRDIPSMKIEKIGYGAGDKDLEIPNLLRVFIGVSNEEYEIDNPILLETNIDNMNMEFFDYISEVLLEKGALDFYITPIYMKKNRPGVIMSVLTKEENLEEVLSIIFKETTTLGVRIQRLQRRKVSREIMQIKSKYGNVRVKIGRIGDEIKNIAPEYEDCKGIARKKGIPLKFIYDEIKELAIKKLRK
jgi:uncharacterized protein (TIGR00299 family) protein